MKAQQEELKALKRTCQHLTVQMTKSDDFVNMLAQRSDEIQATINQQQETINQMQMSGELMKSHNKLIF